MARIGMWSDLMNMDSTEHMHGKSRKNAWRGDRRLSCVGFSMRELATIRAMLSQDHGWGQLLFE
ncbi:MAG: hypothetical protein HQM09_12150 [Candidatus Riflebacteria bacterium]|nr:hypothetical protein [Candidatus Riflebacteria bacterium]